MPGPFVTVEELKTYLVDQGVAQVWKDTPSPVVPGILISPRDGAPQPRLDDGEQATITLVDTMLSPPAALEAWIEEAFIDVIVRARQNSLAKLIHRQIRGLLHPESAHGGRKQWQMAGILVEYSTIWRGEQDHPATDDKTWARTASYRIAVRRKVLAGLPFP